MNCNRKSYSRTVYDTDTGKIISFAPGDILYNQYNFDPVVFAWNMDPKTMPGRSPYEVFGNNPVLYTDHDGDTIKFMGYKDGVNAPVSNEVAKEMWNEMVAYLHTKGFGYLIDQLENSETVYKINFVTGDKVFGHNVDYEDPYIDFNQYQQLRTTNNYVMSPIEGLIHELGHAENYEQDREGYIERSTTLDWYYRNKEERRVIEGVREKINGSWQVVEKGIEQRAAEAIGHNFQNYTRRDHKGTKEPTGSWKPGYNTTGCTGCNLAKSPKEKDKKSIDWSNVKESKTHVIKVENGE